MKRWIRLSIILIIVALTTLGAGIGLTTPAHAAIATDNCQVYFTDGPNQGNTEPVTFDITTGGGFSANASEYVGGVSGPGNWKYTDSTHTTVFFTFPAQLVSPPSTTLTVITTIPVSTTTVVGTSQGTITDSNGNVLVVTHTTTTCPSFVPPPLITP